MKIYISEEYDIEGSNFTFTEHISEYKPDNPYIVDIDDKRLAKWKTILIEKEKIDKKYNIIQGELHDIKVSIDSQLIEVICPECKKSLVFRRDYADGGMFHCYYCDCLIDWHYEKKVYYVHSGKGVASIDRTFWKTDEEEVEEETKRKKDLIERGIEAKKQGKIYGK